MKTQSNSDAAKVDPAATCSPVWYSLADWGDYDIFNGYQHNITHDKHGTKEQAEGVCRGLQREGFGGERRVFPVKTWVSQSLPWENADVMARGDTAAPTNPKPL